MVQETVLSPRRLRTRERKARRILDEADSLLADEGLEGLTVHALSRRLDCSPGALYRYFDSKGAMLAALLARLVEDLGRAFLAVAQVVDAEAGRIDPAAASLLRLLGPIEVYRRLFEAVPRRAALLRHVLGDPRALVDDDRGRDLMAGALSVLGPIAARFDEAVEAGALGAGEAMGRTLVVWSSLTGVLQLGKLGRYQPEAFAALRLTDQLIEALLVGWGADRATLASARRALDGIDSEHPLTDVVRRAVATEEMSR